MQSLKKYVVSIIYYGSFYDKTEINTLCKITQEFLDLQRFQVHYMLKSAFG